MEKIVLIGAGNVGTHLALRFKEQGLIPTQVFSRKITKARKLGKAIGTAYCNKLETIMPDADIYILAVHDGAIEELSKKLSQYIHETALVVHTSGATPSTAIKKHFKNYGVFYPLQTFSITRKANFNEIPICIDAPRAALRKKLERLGKVLGPKVQRVSDKERAILHVAAVFVNNFTNQFYTIADTILTKENITFDLLKPLIQETARKIEKDKPEEMQTGPARRGDQATIERHLKYLEKFPAYKKLYALVSKSIAKED